MKWITALVAGLFIVGGSVVARAQAPSGCPVPPLPSASKDANILTADQAAVVGDLILTQTARQLKLVRDEALDAYAQRIADRMADLGGTGAVQVDLLDLRELNAVTYPGGRILVSRKLVTFAKSEDELAGVLAHELGHVVVRDAERSFSSWLRRALNVTSVGDARDIEAKYNQLLDNQARASGPASSARVEESQQQLADQFAIWLMARAGYDPQAYIDVFDRFAELKSNTGNWLGDLFGSTKPDAKRLRVASKTLAALPAACRAARTSTPAQFTEWQRSVEEASRRGLPIALHGVVSQKKINPPLRSTIRRLRFSPDGRWVMAQDDGNVSVFAREGLAFSFQFASPDAYGAQFTPDSSAIVVYNDSLRVERWSLATKQRDWVHDLVMSGGCLQTALSPDGQWMACATTDFALRVFEVASGTMVFEKKDFYREQLADYRALYLLSAESSNPQFFQMRYSPDAHYLVVARAWSAVAVDLTTRQAISLPGSIRDRVGRSFAFLGNDRIVGTHVAIQEDSGVVTFPGGDVVSKLNLEKHTLTVPTRSDAFLLINDPPAPSLVGVFSIKDNKITGGSRTPGFDIYEDYYLSESRAGEIAIQKAGTTSALNVASIPSGKLSVLRAADVSSDFRVLAVSQSSRGLVWDMETSKWILVRGFRGASVDGQVAYVDFPPDGQIPRAVLRMDPNAQKGETHILIEPPKDASDDEKSGGAKPAASPVKASATVTAVRMRQFGQLLVGTRKGEKKTSRCFSWSMR